ncbi:MAG: LysM peptidoglycan-binding domain-containing protein [Ignavibacteriales bacterium]|nr:LysM peptidoglycan-binding domain-containing protein [Ignavibacteriales bacterium]
MKKVLLLSLVVFALFVTVAPLIAQDEMTKEQWQEQMKSLKEKQTALQADLTKLNGEIDGMKTQSTKLDADVLACEDALYALLGVTRADVEAFDKELTQMENRVAELQRMSDAELVNYKDELAKLDARIKEMAASKISLIPRYGDRVKALQDKITGLLNSIQKEKTYTVGTWGRDRDCLWNIAKKKDIYANAWMWPKIWQGNRDMIKDPDVIKPKWVLKIPDGKELSKEEKSAANRYYRQKVAAAPAEPKPVEEKKP